MIFLVILATVTFLIIGFTGLGLLTVATLELFGDGDVALAILSLVGLIVWISGFISIAIMVANGPWKNGIPGTT